ncbi:MAG: hypothetical protein U1F11_16340 [Steroidobacteraceae bacterium]
MPALRVDEITVRQEHDREQRAQVVEESQAFRIGEHARPALVHLPDAEHEDGLDQAVLVPEVVLDRVGVLLTRSRGDLPEGHRFDAPRSANSDSAASRMRVLVGRAVGSGPPEIVSGFCMLICSVRPGSRERDHQPGGGRLSGAIPCL